MRLDQLPIKNYTWNKFARFIYITSLFFLSLYFFSIGYSNYKYLTNIELSYNSNSQIISNKPLDNHPDNFRLYEKNLEDKTFNMPNTISKFASKLKLDEWRNNEDQGLASHDTKVANIMNKMFGNNYDLNKVSFSKTVPGFFVDHMPKEISFIQETEVRKKLFISIVLPLIVEANRDVTLKRERLKNIYDKLLLSKSLSINEHNWLLNLAIEYSISTKKVTKVNLAKKLLVHIDIIPNSIAIAQSAKESGWGTSRFAMEGNALFGQWTYNDKNGLMPNERNVGDDHLVRSFENLRQSVIAYIDNINKHKAYHSFREQRSIYRENNNKINSLILVRELWPYAESPNYTEVLELIIRSNELDLFDDIKLIDESSLV